MKLSFDPVNGYRVDLPGDQTGEYMKVEDVFDFMEWVGVNYDRLTAVWCHKNKPSTNPDNWLTTQELYDAWKEHESKAY